MVISVMLPRGYRSPSPVLLSCGWLPNGGNFADSRKAAMKKLLIATFAVLADGAAVDLARAAPVATPWSWTGFYVGGNVGYSWGNWDSTSVAAIFPGSPGFTP